MADYHRMGREACLCTPFRNASLVPCRGELLVRRTSACTLLQSKALKFASDTQAQAKEAQTSCPARDGDPLDHHFVTFSAIGGRLVELDGTKLCAIDHGPAPDDGPAFLRTAAETIQRRFMAVDPTNIEFALMALCDSPGGAGAWGLD